jgi:hypothetical protein
MNYYAHVNSKNVLIGIDLAKLTADEYGSENVANIEVTEEFYKNWKDLGEDYYIYEKGNIIKNPEFEKIQLANAKQEMLQEIINKANDFINNEATYKDIECTDNNIAKLTAYITGFNANLYETITWTTKHDNVLVLTMEELTDILVSIGNIQSDVWTNQYINYLNRIESATTLEELKQIEINYTVKEV